MARRCKYWKLGGGCPPCPSNTNMDCWVVPRPKRTHIWLVWCKWRNGEIALRAACTTEKRAKFYLDLAAKEPNVEAAIKEEVMLNHLYLGLFDQKVLAGIRNRGK